jgi:hypothetical protein
MVMVTPGDNNAKNAELIAHVSWIPSGAERVDHLRNGAPDSSVIFQPGQNGLRLEHKVKQFRVIPKSAAQEFSFGLFGGLQSRDNDANSTRWIPLNSNSSDSCKRLHRRAFFGGQVSPGVLIRQPRLGDHAALAHRTANGEDEGSMNNRDFSTASVAGDALKTELPTNGVAHAGRSRTRTGCISRSR